MLYFICDQDNSKRTRCISKFGLLRRSITLWDFSQQLSNERPQFRSISTNSKNRSNQKTAEANGSVVDDVWITSNC